MEREPVDAWLEGYRRAWEQADTPAVLELFTTDASYRSHPLRPAHTGHDGVAAHWAQATADQQDVRDPTADWGRLAGPGQAGPGAGDQARQHAGGWADGYQRAWRAADPEAAAALYAPDAHFRSAPFRDPDLGRAGVLAYTRGTYAAEADQDPRFGTPVAAGSAAAVEWWTTTLEDGRPSTLIGTSFLTFTPDGLVATARDYWFLEPGTHQPFEGWGR